MSPLEPAGIEGDNWERFDSLMSGAGFLEQNRVGWGQGMEPEMGSGRLGCLQTNPTTAAISPLHFPSTGLLGRKIKHRKGN